jgi:hypothetical protein
MKHVELCLKPGTLNCMSENLQGKAWDRMIETMEDNCCLKLFCIELIGGCVGGIMDTFGCNACYDCCTSGV